MNLNVFNWTWRPRYYFFHPWKWISELFSNIRAAWMRATKGYCYMDVWNWNDWFCSVVPPMFHHMADHGCAYPGSEPFDTPEKWHDWLYKMAHIIERLQYDNWMEDNNEYSQDYEKSFEDEVYKIKNLNGPFLTTTNKIALSKEEIHKKYYERCKEIHEMRSQVLEEFGKEFFKHFDALWD